MIKVYRFSSTGWTPQFQSYHLDMIKEIDDDQLNKLNEYQQSLVRLSYANKKIIENVESIANGVWVFLDLGRKNFYLNHLKEAEYLPYHEMELPPNTMVFDGNKIFEKSGYMELGDLIAQGAETAYIPFESYKQFI